MDRRTYTDNRRNYRTALRPDYSDEGCFRERQRADALLPDIYRAEAGDEPSTSDAERARKLCLVVANRLPSDELDRAPRLPLFGRYRDALIRIRRARAALACALREGRHVEANRHRLSVWFAYEYARTGKTPRDPSVVEWPDARTGAADLHAHLEARRLARSTGFAAVDQRAAA